MANTSHSGGKPPVLERLKGAESIFGTEYEIFLGGLLALRARRRGLSFQLFSNVAAARPMDDLVLRVLKPQPLTIFIKLKHASTTGAVSPVKTQAFTSGRGNFCLQKYFEFYADFVSKHTTLGSIKTIDEEMLHDCSLDDVRMVLYTNHPIRRKGATDGPHLHFQHEELLRTGDNSTPNTVFSFGHTDKEVWKLYDHDPRRDMYQQEFLPRLRVFSAQAHVSDIVEDIGLELDALFGAPLPRSDYLLLKYLSILKHWALTDTRGAPLSESSGEVEWLVVEKLVKQGRAAAGGGALRFQAEHCVALRRALEGSQGAVAVTVRGVPAGHRAAKVVQVLDEAFAGRWAYVGDRQLRELPRAALEAACGAGHVQLLLLDAEDEVAAARALVAAVGCSVKVVAVSSGHGAGPLRGGVTMDEEDWRMDHLTLEAQDALMERTLHLQGRPVPLRALEPSWRSVRRDLDGALLSALVRGGAAMGAALPAPEDAHLDLPRTLEHPATLDPAVLEGLDPRSDHLVLSGFPASFLTKLYNTLSSTDGRSGKPESQRRDVTEEEHGDKELEVNDAAIKENKWWTVLPGAGGSSAPEAAFLRVAARADERGLNVHWLHCVGVGAVVWKATRGATQAVAPFVQRASDACGRAPACVHAAEAVRHAAAWRQRVGLLVGEPGMGKSRFLQRLATEVAQRWAVLLQALDHRNLLRDFPQPPDLTQEHLVELLASGVGASSSNSAESTQRFLKAALYESGDIAVLVDGLDEICPSYKDKLVRLLQMLLETKAQLLWVSSRPEAELVLTKALRCATSSLRPFSEEEQKNHLCRHWSSVDPRNRPPAAFEALAAEMVAALHGAAGRGQRSLLDVPLHAQMAAEAYATQAAQALGTRVSLLPQPDVSLYQLYRRFVERKRDLYERRFGLKDPYFANLSLADNFEEIHQNCAMFVLVSNGTFNNVDSSPFRDYLDKNRYNLIKEKNGILWLGDDDEMPHFLHYTFIEYFAASWLLENQAKAPEAVREIWRSLLNRDVGVGVRHILEHMLSDGLPLHRAALESSEGALEAALEAGGDPDESDRFGRTALVQAASLGRADAVSALLAKGCDPARRDELLGWTALRYASACGHLEAAERLLQGGADPEHFVTHDINMKDAVLKEAEFDCPKSMESLLQNCGEINVGAADGGSPPGRAEESDREDTASLQLDHVPDAGACDETGLTPARRGHEARVGMLPPGSASPNALDTGQHSLHHAAAWGKEEWVRTLLDLGADVSARNEEGVTPLHLAAWSGHRRVVELLLERGADANSRDRGGRTPLRLCAESGRRKAARALLDRGGDSTLCDEDGVSALHWAASEGHARLAKLLLDRKADPDARDARGESPLRWATESGKLGTARLLLQHDADASARDAGGVAPLHVAALANHQIARLLLDHGAYVNAADANKRTPLRYALEGGDSETVRLLLKHGADVLSADENGVTPLHIAAGEGQNNVMKLLLNSKADPRARDEDGETPLHWAVEGSKKETASLILQLGGDVNEGDNEGTTVLHVAAANGGKEMVELLLDGGADPNARDKNGRTPLQRAANDGKIETAFLLLEYGADVSAADNEGFTSFHVASKNGHTAVVTLLLTNNARIDAPDHLGRTPLVLAAESGRRDVMLLLLENGARISSADEHGASPIHWAAREGQRETSETLLERGADSNARDTKEQTPLHWTAESGTLETARLLVRHKADVMAKDETGATPLHIASSKGHVPLVHLLLDEGADVNARDKEGAQPLTWAAQDGKEDVVLVLLKHGAEVSAGDNEGSTALHWAVREKQIAVVKLLLENGVTTDERDHLGKTPLRWALDVENSDAVSLLLKHGADITASDHDGTTALHAVSLAGRYNFAKLLLDSGADPKGRDKSGETPLHCAVKNDQEDIALLLLEREAEVSACDGENLTPLHWASRKGGLNIAKRFLQLGADPNARNTRGDTPLMYAAGKGECGVADILLQHGADVEEPDADGLTCLHWAAQNGHHRAVTVLLEHGARPNPTDKQGKTPLIWAAAGGHEEAVRVLLRSGARASAGDADGNTALHWAAGAGHRAVAGVLLAAGADAGARNARGETAAHRATETGSSDTALLLLEHARDASARRVDGATPLHLAARSGQLEPATVLLGGGADPDARDASGQTALPLACEAGHEDVARLLLRHGADARARDRRGVSALHWAALRDRGAIVALLVEHGADLDVADLRGDTPLQWAVRGGGGEAAACLLGRGALVSPADAHGLTPLHWSVHRGRHQMARLLLEHGAPVDAPDAKGRSPLQLAARAGDAEALALLLSHGADVASRDKGGATCLHAAARKGRRLAATLLLKSGADPNARDQRGRTPLLVALEAGRLDAAALLLEHEADVSARDQSGVTALHWAARDAADEMVLSLLVKGADPRARDGKGESPQHWALSGGHAGTALLLAKYCADVPDSSTRYQSDDSDGELLELQDATEAARTKENESDAPLQYAVSHSHKTTVGKGAQDCSSSQEDTTNLSTKSSSDNDLRHILDDLQSFVRKQEEKRYDENEYDSGWEADGEAVIPRKENGENDKVKSPSHSAAGTDSDQAENLKSYKKELTNVNEESQKGSLSLQRSNIPQNIEGNELHHFPTGMTSDGRKIDQLPSLVKEQNDEQTDYLASAVVPHQQNSASTSMMHNLEASAPRSDRDKLEALLSHVDRFVDQRDEIGRTPLHWAASSGDAASARLLIARGSSVAASDEEGATALHLASRAGDRETVLALLENGSDPDARDEIGRTPLTYAAQGGHNEVASLLLRFGANIGACAIYVVPLLGITGTESFV